MFLGLLLFMYDFFTYAHIHFFFFFFFFSLWDEVEIIDRAKQWRIRCLKESAHMLGYNDLLNRPRIEMNTIWEPIIQKVR